MGGIPMFSGGKYFVRMLSQTKQTFRRVFGKGRLKKRKAVIEDNNANQTSCESQSPVQLDNLQQEPSHEEMTNDIPVSTEPVVDLAEDSPSPENESEHNSLVVASSCGELENAYIPLELQDKVYELRQKLFQQFPPFYDFCIISSDEDIEEATEFKNSICRSFNLMGCTVYEGWWRSGASPFDCYDRMIVHSSKVFFYITKNFTEDAFCKRLQSGAVFQSLMSKYSLNHEKCVPVYPQELDYGRFHLSLSGVNGLMPFRPHLMHQSIRNTYTYELKAIRHLKNKQQYEKRCIEYKKEVTSYLDQYNSSNMLRIQNETHLALPCTSSNGVTDVVPVEVSNISCNSNSEIKDCKLSLEVGHNNDGVPSEGNRHSECKSFNNDDNSDSSDSESDSDDSDDSDDIEEKKKEEYPTEEDIIADMPEEIQSAINSNPSKGQTIVIKDVENAQIGNSLVVYQTIIQAPGKKSKKCKKSNSKKK